MTVSKLAKHCRRRRGEIARLADAAGVTPEQMGRIVSGQRGSSLEVALAIADATNGLITPSDVAAAKINTQKGKRAAGGHR
jgi:DNA-binding transcriptional regulator YdaS (Cro superfamily)